MRRTILAAGALLALAVPARAETACEVRQFDQYTPLSVGMELRTPSGTYMIYPIERGHPERGTEMFTPDLKIHRSPLPYRVMDHC
jgi:hypothetical protein